MVGRHVLESVDSLANNAVLLSRRGHPVWERVFEAVAHHAGGGNVDPVQSTGPRMVERVVKAWNKAQPAAFDHKVPSAPPPPPAPAPLD